MTLADLVPDTAARVEETLPFSPVFWSLTYEFLPALVDALFDASLITGTVQATDIQVTLAAGTTYFDLQNNTAIGIPEGVIAALRLKAPYAVRKTSLASLDATVPNWQSAAPLPPETRGSSIISWFPLGVSKFGIYPQLLSDSFVTMDFLISPIVAPRPYVTTLPVNFQEEFTSAFPEYAAVVLRAKELGEDSEEAAQVMNEYLQQMKQLSLFQNRLDSLVLTAAYGAKAGVQKRELV